MATAEKKILSMEEKRTQVDWENVWAKVSKMRFTGLKESYEYVYKEAFAAGKAAGLREKKSS